MAGPVELGDLQPVVEKLVESGRFASESDVVREGIRLVEQRERRRAELDAALAEGLADVESGRVIPAEEVFDELKNRYRPVARERRL